MKYLEEETRIILHTLDGMQIMVDTEDFAAVMQLKLGSEIAFHNNSGRDNLFVQESFQEVVTRWNLSSQMNREAILSVNNANIMAPITSEKEEENEAEPTEVSSTFEIDEKRWDGPNYTPKT
jgi:hypothetical protein